MSFLVQRVLPALLVDHHKAVAPVAVRQHQPLGFKRRIERLAVIRMFEAIENGRADRPHVRPEAAAFLHLSLRSAMRAPKVFRLPVIAHLLRKANSFFERCAASSFQPQFVKAGVMRPVGLGIDAEPSGVKVFFAGRLVDVKAPHAGMAGETEALFFALNEPPSIARCLAPLRAKASRVCV